MIVPPERYIMMFKDLKIRRIGVIHDPAKTGWYLRLVRKAAQEAGIELLIREVTVPRDTLSRISGLTGKVDALWMIPDTTAVTRETIEAYFRFA
ncbi:MAG: hypothetical protein JJE30_05925 [Desulfuromonadales bacterium]|nr:hypothetical protein [Desulfuromonadales bacterium]